MRNEEFEVRDASELAEEHYTAYGTYVNQTRAIASVYDGFKHVQRRIIYEANKLPDKLTKSTNLIGKTIMLHPHGSSSIYSAIIGMANPTCNLKLFDTKGNWGGYGCGAAADRYTECKLSEIARFIYCQFIDYAPMQEGEIYGVTEPEYLPCLIPYGLLEGTSGMGVGLAADVVPLNLLDLIEYYLYYIKNDKFSDSLIIRPEFGSMILWMTDDECRENIWKYKGSFQMGSIITQESETVFVIESIYGKSIDKVLSKLKKYIDTDKVDFRNETKTYPRYVFEIMDSSVDPIKFKQDLSDATWKRSTFNRVFDVSGKSTFCNLNYVIEKQMKALNKAIDLKISTELAYHEKRRELFEALLFFKSKGTLDMLTKKTEEQVISEMMAFKKYPEEVCREILRKPSSYLTKSHDYEIEEIYKAIEDLKSHNRKEYLISLYEDLKKLAIIYLSSRHHTILESQMLSNPKAKLIWEDDVQKIQITDKGRGLKFDNAIYLVGESGTVYRRSISTVSKQVLNLDVDEIIVDIVSDRDKYICMNVDNDYGVVFSSDNYKYDKKWVNLMDNQKIKKVISYSESNVPDNVRNGVRSKICKPFRY